MANNDIKKEISNSGLRLWHVADAFEISDSYFSILLRRELTDSQKSEIRNYINGKPIQKDVLKRPEKTHRQALIDCCPTCGHIIRTHWTICPNCGSNI